MVQAAKEKDVVACSAVTQVMDFYNSMKGKSSWGYDHGFKDKRQESSQASLGSCIVMAGSPAIFIN